tara:strand:+ start:841 stop:1815 length:975 start_codon:yes stop_codon:yes gene_type:complete
MIAIKHILSLQDGCFFQGMAKLYGIDSRQLKEAYFAASASCGKKRYVHSFAFVVRNMFLKRHCLRGLVEAGVSVAGGWFVHRMFAAKLFSIFSAGFGAFTFSRYWFYGIKWLASAGAFALGYVFSNYCVLKCYRFFNPLGSIRSFNHLSKQKQQYLQCSDRFFVKDRCGIKLQDVHKQYHKTRFLNVVARLRLYARLYSSLDMLRPYDEIMLDERKILYRDLQMQWSQGVENVYEWLRYDKKLTEDNANYFVDFIDFILYSHEVLPKSKEREEVLDLYKACRTLFLENTADIASFTENKVQTDGLYEDIEKAFYTRSTTSKSFY